jgi:regulator of sigma D
MSVGLDREQWEDALDINQRVRAITSGIMEVVTRSQIEAAIGDDDLDRLSHYLMEIAEYHHISFDQDDARIELVRAALKYYRTYSQPGSTAGRFAGEFEVVQ